MAEQDISRIAVGKHSISITGLGQTISQLSSDYRNRSDDEVGRAMLEVLAKSNYIPQSAREEYAKAFIREFRKSLEQPYTEAVSEGLEIKVLGAGCAQCNNLEQMVMEVLTELNISASLEHVTDIREIARYGIMGVPALVINGKAASSGTVPPRNKLKTWILAASSQETKK